MQFWFGFLAGAFSGACLGALTMAIFRVGDR